MLRLLLKNRVLALMDRFAGRRSGKKATSTARIVLFSLLGLALLVMIGGFLASLIYPLFDAFSQGGLTWLAFALAGCATVLASFMLTMFYAQGAIFEAKDNELLLSMPIPPSAILGSRLGAVYLLNLLVAVIIMGAAGMLHIALNGASVIGVVILVLSILLLALISTTLSCLLGWLVSLLTRRMRRKTLFSLIISLALLGVFYYVLYGLGNQLQAIIDNSGSIAKAFRGALFPFYALGVGIADNDIVRFLLFAACCIVPFAVICFALSRSFIKIVTSRVGAKKTEYKAKALKESSVAWAMAKKDLLHLVNSSTYMLNSALGLVFCLILAGATLFSGNALINLLLKNYTGIVDAGEAMPYLVTVILGTVTGTTYISGPSISIEGKNIWILKCIPVKASEVLKGKLLSHLVPTVPVTLVSSILFIIAIPMNALEIFAIILIPQLTNLFCALIGLLSNLFFGRLDYPSEARAIKSASTALVPMLSTAALAIAPAVLYFKVFKPQGITFATAILATIALLVVIDLILYVIMNSSLAQRRWDQIGR